jgi:tetratricopeptide (TPR) repeat protein
MSFEEHIPHWRDDTSEPVRCRAAALDGDIEALRCWLQWLINHDRLDDAESVLRRFLDEPQAPNAVEALLNLGGILERFGNRDWAAQAFRAAATAGNTRAMVYLAGLVPEEAEYWTKAAVDGGDQAAWEPYGDALLNRGLLDEAVYWYAREDGLPKPPRAPGVWLTATAVVVTVAVVPFVQALASKAGEQAYNRIRDILRRIATRHDTHEWAAERSGRDGVLLVVRDPVTDLELHIRTKASNEALKSLADLALPAPEPGAVARVRVRWDDGGRVWRALSPDEPDSSEIWRSPGRRD